MKKILTIMSVCALSTAVFAQGTIQWTAPGSAFIGQTNSSVYSGFVPAGQNATPGTGVTAGGASGQLYYYALLTSVGLSAAPTTLAQFNGGTLANSWLSTGLMMTNSSANGRISPVGGAINNAVAANWASGSTQNAILVGWSANLGADWATVLLHLNTWDVFGLTVSGNAFFGVDSRVAVGLTPSTANPGIVVIGPGLIDGSTATGAPAVLQLLGVAVPEPGTMALAGLGGLALLAFRRKK